MRRIFNYNDYIVIEEAKKLSSKTGFVYRAYDRDSGRPLSICGETLNETVEKLKTRGACKPEKS